MNKREEIERPATGPVKNLKRYSDEELEEFRQLILCRLEEARSDYEQLRSALSGAGDNGTDDTAHRFRLSEEGFEGSSREEIAQLAIRRQNYMGQLQNALVRIENKTYGVCRVSGKLIEKERLRSVPHTTLSMDVKMKGVRQQ
jgi:DnaK suppressor protein